MTHLIPFATQPNVSLAFKATATTPPKMENTNKQLLDKIAILEKHIKGLRDWSDVDEATIKGLKEMIKDLYQQIALLKQENAVLSARLERSEPGFSNTAPSGANTSLPQKPDSVPTLGEVRLPERSMGGGITEEVPRWVYGSFYPEEDDDGAAAAAAAGGGPSAPRTKSSHGPHPLARAPNGEYYWKDEGNGIYTWTAYGTKEE